MRIFYASGQMTNQAVPGSKLWRNNLYLSLVDLGHDVIEFNYNLEPLISKADFNLPGHREFVSEHRPGAERELLRQIKAAHLKAPIQLFFSYFYSSCARAEVIREIRSMGIVTVNWYCNASYQINLVQDIAPAYDYCLVPEKFRLEDYRRLGANPVYCQEAANPNTYKPLDTPRDIDVLFLGARYADRPLYLRRLVDAGVSVRVFGPGWQLDPGQVSARRNLLNKAKRLMSPGGMRAGAKYLRRKIFSPPGNHRDLTLPPDMCGDPLSDEEMIRAYSRSKISLGFSTVGETHLDGQRITQVRLRDFEAPMCGAFYMVEYMPELEEFFEIGKEIVCYTDPDDLADKCKYYLKHDAERERIRLAGYKRAVNDHSWQRRFETVFRQIGLAQ